MFINASFIDQALLVTGDAEQEKWQVHSKYKNSFNIQDERKKQLVVITTTDYPFMPNGIYIEKTDFLALLAAIDIGEGISWRQNTLQFSRNHLFLMHAKRYSSVMQKSADMRIESQEKLFSCVDKLEEKTGSQNTLVAFIAAKEPFSQAVKQLCLKADSQQKLGLEFLLGRGMGLTPSGDDMIVGHLAARFLLEQENDSLNNLLLTELLSEQSLTTDISKHYLLCALSARFSEPVLHLVGSLTIDSSEEQIEKNVRAILSVGHTSGVDLLAGLITTIKLLSIN
ncbi:DUF2877 domain-containing protein [Enterococcus ureilyticus]|uniref:DUF2877 domain-containing protein n=1 Tax=Enterococcus ureilyticus TaxID=1131292 RepID=UPI001A91BDCF|nr:DUF2877 domain-containing protein [Enterococcus ureilyticus]MBO0447322.1 DUF2877 domain-containing protein [Enterococcus ureilyticus]